MREVDIPTPALVIDLPTTKKNIERMASYVAGHGLSVRPHTKTHKSVCIARMQCEAGAIGLSVAKAGEAGVMATVSDDILVAYPAWDPPRVSIIAQLAKSKTIRVAVDSTIAVDHLDAAAAIGKATIGVLVDFDTGMHRTGLQEPSQALELAKCIDSKPNLRLDGLFTYQGNITGEGGDIEVELRQVAMRIHEVLALWRDHGLQSPIVSGGSTPTAYYSHFNDALTEIRPGTYAYLDRNYATVTGQSFGTCAAQVVATVVSNAVPGKVVLDCGSKTLAMDGFVGGPSGGHGLIVEYPNATIDNLTEEHGRVDVTQCDQAPKLGERVHVIPNHICVCVNLQNHVWLKNDEVVEQVPVDTRGMLS